MREIQESKSRMLDKGVTGKVRYSTFGGADMYICETKPRDCSCRFDIGRISRSVMQGIRVTRARDIIITRGHNRDIVVVTLGLRRCKTPIDK